MVEEPTVVYRTIVSDSSRWEGFERRPGDIVITTPAKCGTTWMQMICALLVFQTADLDRPLSRYSPWLDMLTRDRDEVFAELAAQTHRRFIKTHTGRDGLPFDDDVMYVCVGRDPRDVALSWDNHLANMDFASMFTARDKAVGNEDLAELFAEGPPVRADTPQGRFRQWVDDPADPVVSGCSLHNVLHHLGTWWEVRDAPNVVLLHYADLRADLDGQMRGLADRLGIDIPEARRPALVEAATFERMRDRADEVAPSVSESIWQDNKQFFHRGTGGQWRDLFDEAELRHYEDRVRELAAPDLAAWVHQGSVALPA